MVPFLLIGAAEEIATEWESGGVIFLQLSAILFLVFLNGFFVAAEFAIVKIRSSQLDALIEQGVRGAKFTRHVTAHMDAYLSACQLGITLASLALGWLGEPVLSRLLQPLLIALHVSSEGAVKWISIVVGFTLITTLHITLGEQAPKVLAIRKPVPTALWISRPLGLFYAICKPLIWCLNGTSNAILKYLLRLEPVDESELAHSEEELRVILTESQKAEEVSSLGRELLINALDFKRRVAREIMTPRGEVIFLNTKHTFEENLEIAQRSRHTRFPLCEGYLDNAIGLVHIKDLLMLTRAENPDLIAIKRDVVIVPEMMPLEKLLTFFLARHAHLALVVDEYGGTVGIVTLDNVLEELVGEIQDEFDTDIPEYRKVNDDEFVIDGRLGLYELQDLTGIELESADVTTVGGYVTHLLGHLPKVGESTRIGDFEVTITQADGRRVGQLQFKKIGSGSPEETGEKPEGAEPRSQARLG